MNLKRSVILLLICFGLSLVGCGRYVAGGELGSSQEVKVIPARVPSGVMRYCWEEPVVDEEQHDAGLDARGIYWSPSYVAIREVRQGRWRPCKAGRVN